MQSRTKIIKRCDRCDSTTDATESKGVIVVSYHGAKCYYRVSLYLIIYPMGWSIKVTNYEDRALGAYLLVRYSAINQEYCNSSSRVHLFIKSVLNHQACFKLPRVH